MMFGGSIPAGLFEGMFGGSGGTFGSAGADDEDDDNVDGDKESGRVRPKVDTTRFYDLLGIDKSANASEVKKAYYKMAKEHHPDKGGDVERFQDIQKAFEVLSDPDLRKRYDQHGEEGLEDVGKGRSPQDIFAQMFGGAGPSRGRGDQRPRTKDVVRQLWVSLEELYTGTSRPVPLVRKVIAENAGDGRQCEACDGKGVILQVVHMPGLGMMQQIGQQCPGCNGRGMNIKMKSVQEVLDVFVEKGSPDGHKIVLHGKADEGPGREPGDLQVIVKQQDHPRFMRKGADLYMEQDLSLAEALTGFRVVVQHLDGRKLIVRNKPGEVLQLSKGMAIKAVANAGMPIHKDPFKSGNLFLIFNICFPAKLEVPLARELRRLLGEKPLPEDESQCIEEGDDEVELCVVEDIDPVESSRQKKCGQAYEEDEDDGPGVQCKQQ